MYECYRLRHVWFVSSPKGREFFALPTANYITGSLFIWKADPITLSDCWLATDWLIAPCFLCQALALGNIKVIIDCNYSDPPFNLPHHFIVYSVSSSMWLSLIVCCVFSTGNGPRTNRSPTIAAQFPLSQYYCYWGPATKASWCDIHQRSTLCLLQVPSTDLLTCHQDLVRGGCY